MPNPVDFAEQADATRDRLGRDLRLCQQRCDELQSLMEHELREAALRETTLRLENNSLRAAMRTLGHDIDAAMEKWAELREATR